MPDETVVEQKGLLEVTPAELALLNLFVSLWNAEDINSEIYYAAAIAKLTEANGGFRPLREKMISMGMSFGFGSSCSTLLRCAGVEPPTNEEVREMLARGVIP